MHLPSFLTTAAGWLAGLLFAAIGLVNVFWGNDALFGVFLVGLALLFFPPVNRLLQQKTGFAIPVFVKLLGAAFIIWASLGVGELPQKIDLMLQSF
ncbi:MAG TPA: hypothetical protein PKE63_10605 [Lacibacter sp.]|nr:hypothetical protein [Lacibacter sp.]HMO89877.1 hypothetical protein [Lacibacter sp.]HMP87719.1 hypothetical protein [Lacibacter sp.]